MDKRVQPGEVLAAFCCLDEERKYKPKDISRKGRELLAYALNTHFGISEDPLEIGTRERGKPYLLKHPEIEFNISHSGRYVLVALAHEAVGADVQEIEDRELDSLAKHVCSPDELRAYNESGDKADYFFRLWVRKEAYIKWTGDGLYRELKTIPFAGWFQFLDIDPAYCSGVHAARPLTVRLEEVDL